MDRIRLDTARRMEALGTLAGGIAHDFNNLLAMILGYTELTMDGLPSEAPERAYLQEVLAAGIRARDLVHQILMFSRQGERTSQPLQFKTMAKEALKLLRASIPSTIEIRTHLTSDGLVMADAGQLHQLVLTVCSEAAQVMPPEGGVIDVSLDDTDAPPDSGPGLGKCLRWMVSATPASAGPTGAGAIGSHGPGLGAADEIATGLGGRMVEERPAQGGIRIQVFLPLLTRPRPSTQAASQDLPRGTGKEHILVVDDEASVGKMVGMMLQSLHYQVTILSSSIEALALFREKAFQFDLVLTDLTMPHLTGQKLALELNKIRPQVPIILCTGYSGEISEARAARSGIQATIFKPIEKAELARTVRALLDRSGAPA